MLLRSAITAWIAPVGFSSVSVIIVATTFIMMVSPMTMFALVIPAFIIMPLAAIFPAFAITGGINFVVPSVPNKVDLPPASVILAAMLAPVLFMSGWYMQIKRFGGYWVWSTFNDHRLPIDDFRLGLIADVDATVETGLADTD